MHWFIVISLLLVNRLIIFIVSQLVNYLTNKQINHIVNALVEQLIGFRTGVDVIDCSPRHKIQPV